MVQKKAGTQPIQSTDKFWHEALKPIHVQESYTMTAKMYSQTTFQWCVKLNVPLIFWMSVLFIKEKYRKSNTTARMMLRLRKSLRTRE